MPQSPQPVFDGHNDVLLKLWQSQRADKARYFFEDQTPLDVDGHKAKIGGLFGGICAIFVPDQPINPGEQSSEGANFRSEPGQTKGALNQEASRYFFDATLSMVAILQNLAQTYPDHFMLCKSTTDLLAAKNAQKFGAIMHIEGAEAIDEDLENLHLLYQQGLRSIGPCWQRSNIFGTGIGHQFPPQKDQGGGISQAGKRLVAACNQLGIMLDLSHMNEKGFYDIAQLSQAPLVATHSNAQALCQSARNLSDDQILTIGQSGGLIGINFGVIFLRSDGQRNAHTPIDTIIDHICYIGDKIGLDHIGFGSDFDGTTLSKALPNAAYLPKLVERLKQRGFDQDSINRLCFANWMRVLRQSIDKPIAL